MLLAISVALCAIGVANAARAPRALGLYRAPTPHFHAPHYVTSGGIPQVAGDTPHVWRVNKALRLAIRADQRRYGKGVRRAERAGVPPGQTGTYRTYFHPSLASASTVVVSALIPALELYPGGNDGQTWISVTVDMGTGKRVSLAQLVNREALPVITQAWGPAFLQAHPRCRWCSVWLRTDKPSYPATFGNLGWYALNPTGLAIGFPQYPAGPRTVAVIPYRLVRAYLSPLGVRLIDGVRKPLVSQN